MAEKTKKKVNKMAIAVITLSLALIAAIGGIFGVYAALQQNVSTTFSVQYSIGKNVAVAIGAKTANTTTAASGFVWTWFESDSTTVSKDPNNLYHINATSNNQNLNLHLPGSDDGVMRIGDSAQLVTFYMQNISDAKIKVTITDNSIITGGMVASYTAGIVPTTDGLPSQYLTDVALTNKEYTMEIGVGEIGCFFIAIGVSNYEDLNRDASYTSNVENGIEFVFEQA